MVTGLDCHRSRLSAEANRGRRPVARQLNHTGLGHWHCRRVASMLGTPHRGSEPQHREILAPRGCRSARRAYHFSFTRREPGRRAHGCAVNQILDAERA